MPVNKLSQTLSLLVSLAVCFVAAGVGAAASVRADTFYAELVRPGWAPPAWVFGPVWTTLYAMMAIAAWLVWQEREQELARVALLVFFMQLLLNSLWSWLFFHWQLGALALLEIVLLWMLIAATTVLFWRVRPLAGALLLPYLAWVSFAAVLNYSIWQLNPAVLA